MSLLKKEISKRKSRGLKIGKNNSETFWFFGEGSMNHAEIVMIYSNSICFSFTKWPLQVDENKIVTTLALIPMPMEDMKKSDEKKDTSSPRIL